MKRHHDTHHKMAYGFPKKSRRLSMATEEDIQRKEQLNLEVSDYDVKLSGG